MLLRGLYLLLTVGGAMTTIYGVYLLVRPHQKTQDPLDQWSWSAFFFPQVFSIAYGLTIPIIISLLPIPTLILAFYIFFLSWGELEVISIILVYAIPVFHTSMALWLGNNGLKQAYGDGTNWPSYEKFRHFHRFIIFFDSFCVVLIVFLLVFLGIKESELIAQQQAENQSELNTFVHDVFSNATRTLPFSTQRRVDTDGDRSPDLTEFLKGTDPQGTRPLSPSYLYSLPGTYTTTKKTAHIDESSLVLTPDGRGTLTFYVKMNGIKTSTTQDLVWKLHSGHYILFALESDQLTPQKAVVGLISEQQNKKPRIYFPIMEFYEDIQLLPFNQQ